jgi:putative phage-type endonuclease
VTTTAPKLTDTPDITAERIPDLEPGTPEWATKATASKVAAMLGLSPHESPFQLWHRMRGDIPWEVDNDTLRRGHYLEPAIAHWFADQHPTWVVDITGAWANLSRPGQVATPDRLLKRRNIARTPFGLLEVKSANNDWEWGAELTDEVPDGYRAQALWQMDTLGLDVCHFAVLMPYMEFREFVVPYDAEDAKWVRDKVRAFMDSVEAGAPEPDIDESDHTYQAIRKLHPDIADRSVELTAATAAAWLDAIRAEEAAKHEKTAAKSAVAAEMGDAKAARFAGVTYATRQSKAGGTPYVVAARGLAEREGNAS